MNPPPPRKSPLSKNHDLSEVTAKQLQLQLCWELERVKERTGLGNEALALELGFKSGASVSRWLNGHDPVSGTCAKALDRLGHEPEVGGSFTELQQAYIAATRRRRGRRRRKTATTHYDLFLASPMASLGSKRSYETERKAAKDLKQAIENFLNLKVYYAGQDLESKEEFDSPRVAAERNFEALDNASYFVLLSVSKEAIKPSSVTVEAGYALARKIPSLYLVRNPEYLPFVLRSLGSIDVPELPAVEVVQVESGERAVGLMRHQGEEILNRLEEETRPGKS